MTAYLPIIISAIVIFTALMWWLLALGSVKKDAAPTDSAPPKVVPAPPVAAAPPPAAPKVAASAKPMDDPRPASKAAAPKAQAPLKAAATKPAPTKTAAPSVKKTVAPKVAAPKVAAPKAATAKVAAPKPVAASKPKAAAKPPSVPDNLLLLKGVGPKVNTMLKDMGVTSFDQVANWTPADIIEIDSKLGAFAGRIGRDNWVEQARLLAAGDVAGFEKKYGALGSEAKS